jgi:hypothetical protein
MDHASGTVYLFNDITNVCSWMTHKHIPFVKMI